MNKGLVGVGLIGGIIVLAGIFSPLASISGTIMGSEFSLSASAWDSITGAEISITIAGIPVSAPTEVEIYAILVLVGGALVLISALGLLASPGMKNPAALLVIGGVLAIVGAVWGYLDISSELETIAAVPGISAGVGYGIYLFLVGGILGLAGAYGARK